MCIYIHIHIVYIHVTRSAYSLTVYVHTHVCVYIHIERKRGRGGTSTDFLCSTFLHLSLKKIFMPCGVHSGSRGRQISVRLKPALSTWWVPGQDRVSVSKNQKRKRKENCIIQNIFGLVCHLELDSDIRKR